MSDQQYFLNRQDAVPLSTQLKDIIRGKITSGEWAPNTMIPSENRLSEIYGLSRMTVRSVITQFVTQGYLYRIQGKGTFVSGTKFEFDSLGYSGLRKQLEEQGHDVQTILLSCNCAPAGEFVGRKLNLHPNEAVYCIRRVRSVNGTRISYHKSYVPAALCPALEEKELQNEPLCRIMNESYCLRRGRVIETLESYSADRSKAGYLNIHTGFPLLLLQDQLFTMDNTVYEYSCVYFRGDIIKIRMEYTDHED